VPDQDIATRLDVTPWLEQKVAAVLAHRCEVERGALPGLVAGLSPDDRARLLATEWYAVFGRDAMDEPELLGPL
jgi:N-acetyl-1-D-myo-inositol-2-amino-2-deoxy-alpha-D-glucopyranoside deacetylase